MENGESNEISECKESLESQYIQSMTMKEKKAYIIAKTHLMSSFSLKKSNGYIHFTEAKMKITQKT